VLGTTNVGVRRRRRGSKDARTERILAAIAIWNKTYAASYRLSANGVAGSLGSQHK
jgi:hypothetical protein